MGDGCGDGDGEGDSEGDGATCVRLSVPWPIHWWMENGASASANCGGVLLKAHMIFCISSSRACAHVATFNIKKPSAHRRLPNLLVTSLLYRSVSSRCTGGARRVTIALSRPEPGEAGSSGVGCISFTVRVAPIRSADDGAINSELTNMSASPPERWYHVEKLTFAYAQEGKFTEWDDQTAGREVPVEVCVANY